MSRVKINESGEGVKIEIKGHNSLLHMFFTLLVFNAAAAFIILMLPVFGTVGAVLGFVFFFTYGAFMVFELTRSILWTVAGKEIIEKDRVNLIYTKQIFNFKKVQVIPGKEIMEVKVVDYAEPKNVLQMIRSEMGAVRSFLVKTEDKKYLMGIYLSVDEVGEIEKHL